MRLLLALLLAGSSAWAQRDGEPSPTERQQQKQSDYARKGHPAAGKPKKQEPASLKTKDRPSKSKPGEAGLRTPSK